MKYADLEDKSVLFTGQLRSFVLGHVLKHTDLTDRIENLGPLTKLKGHEFAAVCPWCGAGKGFSLNKKSGACACSACSENGDLVDLLYASLGKSMDYIIGMFTCILEQGGEL